MKRLLKPIRFFMLILTLSTNGPLSPPLIAQDSKSATEAALHWQLSTSLDNLDSLSSRLILESSLLLGPSPTDRLDAQALVLERERFPLDGERAWTHEFLPGLALDFPKTESFIVVGPLSSNGLLKRLEAPLGRSLATLEQPDSGSFTLDRGASPTKAPAIALGLGTINATRNTGIPLSVSTQAFLDEERLALGARIAGNGTGVRYSLEGIALGRGTGIVTESPWFPGIASTRPAGGTQLNGLSAILRGPFLSGRLTAAWSQGTWIATGRYLQGQIRLAGTAGVFGLGADACSDDWQDADGNTHELAWRIESAWQSPVLRKQRVILRVQGLAERGELFTVLARGRWERTGSETRGIKSMSLSHEQGFDQGCASEARSEANASLRAGGFSASVAVQADWAATSFGTGAITLGAGYIFGKGGGRKGPSGPSISMEGRIRLGLDDSANLVASPRIAAAIEGERGGLRVILLADETGPQLAVRARFSGIFY